MSLPEEKVQNITVSNKELSESILPTLLGSVFHVTNGDFIKSIFEAGAIRNNQNGDYSFTFPQSSKNYGTRNGMVCLIDLRAKNYEEAQKHASDGYCFLRPKSDWKSVAFFILDSSYFTDLKQQARFDPPLVGGNHIPMEEIYTGTYIPEIECWYQGDVSLDKFSKILVANIT